MTTKEQTTAVATKPVAKLRLALSAESTQEQFRNALDENAGAFISSIIDVFASDRYLMECDPNAVIMECLKAATLKLPINKQLGFAYIIAYAKQPQFQMGYKGYIQLAMRTGQYRFINAGPVPVSIKVNRDYLTGEIKFIGEPTDTKAQGYVAYFEMMNGFSKALYMTVDEVIDHAKKYSQSFGRKNSAWETAFEAMAAKTPLKLLLSHYGILSTEMISALDSERDDEVVVASEIAEFANSEAIDITSATEVVIEGEEVEMVDVAPEPDESNPDW